ncbi:MAG: hypothetical protein HKN84_06215, partial [Gammaproteobacteria bacterium]|nr:hypothetical protein [Gammaproteobacteria bacterium]
HLALVTELERRFDIKFESAEMISLNSVERIVAVIESHAGGTASLAVAIPPEYNDADFDNLQNALAYLSEDVESFSIDRPGFRVQVTLAGGADPAPIRARIGELTAKLISVPESNLTHTLFERKRRERLSDEGVFAELVRSRQVIEHGPGVFSLHGRFLELLHALDNKVVELANDMNAAPALYPVSIPLETLKKSNFFSSYPHFANFVSTLREDMENISEFSGKASESLAFDFLEHLNAPKMMCRSAGCLHSYPSFEHQIFEHGRVECITMVGRMFRNESKNIGTLERLNEYTMREIIVLGSPEYVAESLTRCIRWFEELLEHLNLTGSIQTANDPFFADNLATLQFFQRSQQTKIEVRMVNPASGNQVSVGSINNHGSHFGKSYNIRFDDDTFVNSGCVGWGYERLIFLILSQHGMNESAWPQPLRELFASQSTR